MARKPPWALSTVSANLYRDASSSDEDGEEDERDSKGA
jgi:hypothetical protein